MGSFDTLQSFLGLSIRDLPIEPRAVGDGRGLFATVDIPPSTPLFTIPARALLNIRTLAPHYPPGLTAIQLIALHLCLYRPVGSARRSLDPLFGSYLSTLPVEFDFHPLTGRVLCTNALLPPSVASALESLHNRYLQDWHTVQEYLQTNSRQLSMKPHIRLDRSNDALEGDFLWGWLNVNTRCIYHRLKSTRSHPDNLTLCPILDFGNHTVAGPCMTPRLSDAERSNTAPIPRLGDPLTLLSPDTPTKPGEELYLTYGAHPNRTLFVEYGFVVPCTSDDSRAEVEVQDLVEPLFDTDDGAVKRKMLQDCGYWGDWTLDGSPAVSYRLITALRLLHVSLVDSNGALQRWQDTLTGLRDTISEVNEAAWKETVVEVCAALVQRANTRRSSVPGDVSILWAEELQVASRVSNMLN
ncbi:hypothetical protein C8F04DRAFT_1061658 [Mycena alexandri]|uniref:SET domain-containing protein n=1 Tax=Mycena alexandri TaxID=1745969 RepID=A0AAD6XBY4_9AGAR|nr:hypothetical protein C8F04DRAFT_1061658 [Mycena alexandri]